MKIFCSIAFALYVDDMACGAKCVLGSLGVWVIFFFYPISSREICLSMGVGEGISLFPASVI